MFELMQGDCLELMKRIPDNSVDMILCDLPYGTTACKWDSVIPFEALWAEYWRVCKPNAAVVLTSAQPFTTALAASQMKNFKYSWIWVKDRKTNPMQAKQRPMGGHEEVCVFYKKLPIYNPQFANRSKPISAKTPKTKSAVYGSAGSQSDDYVRRTDTICPDTVIWFPTQRGLHPTQKPVALMEYLIRTYTHEGMTVLDNCFGSGTTGVACANTGRKFIGIEMDEKYFEIAKNRVESAYSKNELEELK